MAATLVELLQRIRPVGTPGAALHGGMQRERAAAEELAEITAILDRFQAEVSALIDDAQERAEQIRIDAERSATRLRSEMPARVAIAGALDAFPSTGRPETEADRYAVETAIEIARRRNVGEREMDDVVDAALASIWSMLPEAGST